ncbi:site-specific integrase [Chroococcidiopsis cubana]|uniref:tyrosine-type recombinase/integrase n=1 Tax=Chroococcidiopsis cubana TaxID=171392 RepID=UPI0015E659DA|nr:site-specific integrase [Chroococcidiopsis cubana]
MIDCDEGRKEAQVIAKQVELDLLAGGFDPTFRKYKSSAVGVSRVDVPPPSKTPPKTVEDLFESFLAYKQEILYKASLQRYSALLKHIKRSDIGKLPASALTPHDVALFVSSIKSKYAAISLKQRLILLAACWDWAELPNNSWKAAVKAVKLPPKMRAKVFTQTEVQAILSEIQRTFPHYWGFVLFLFGTGCRLGEAIGLQWKHVSDDCSTIWVGEAVTALDGRKPTKTNQARIITLSPSLRNLLLGMKSIGARPEDPLFTTEKGRPVMLTNFRLRVWKPTLQTLDIPYRPASKARATFVTHCLQSGMAPIEVSALSGHSTQVMYQHYAGLLSAPQIPELYQ